MAILAEKKELKRKQITKAGITVFLQKGFHDTRVEDIATKAKVGKGTFYLYFKSKEDMVNRLTEELLTDVFKTLAWVSDNIDEKTNLIEVFKEEAQQLVKTLEANKQFAKFLFKEGRSISKNMDNKINNFYNELIDMAESTYAVAMATGLMPKQHPRVAAICVIGGTIQMYQLYLNGSWDGTISELVDASLIFFIRALT